jgi:DNA repair exonuclease SbcCD nuclease subunit
MNYLLVGDAHIRPQDIEEGERLIDLCKKSILEYNVDNLVFMGDQTHFHDLVHNSVLNFWGNSFRDLSEICKKVIVLVGNHDVEKGRYAHSMAYFKNIKNMVIVDEPRIFDHKLFLPYTSDNSKLIQICNNNSSFPDLVCHAEFNDALFENGFQITKGINLEDIPQKRVWSGHIHRMGFYKSKLLYTGSPRWLTASDANTEKFIWVTDFNGKIDKINTKNHCSPIYIFEDKEGSSQPNIDDLGINPRITIDIHGSLDYIKEKKTVWENVGFKVRTFPPKTYKIKIKESDGLVKSFNKYFNEFIPSNGTSKERLQELLTDKVSL